MKKTILFSVALFTTLLLAARNVTPEEAEQSARQFLSKCHPASRSARIRMAARQPLAITQASDAAAYYVFNVGQDKGYVMISGSDLAPQVLAYATSGSFDQERMPDNMRTWIQGYADQIAYLEKTGGKYQIPRKVVEHPAISPLLTSKWNQNAPYYNLCPKNASGAQTVTGCVATALAQILNYYKFPAQTVRPIPSYTTNTLGIRIDEAPVTTIDWANMLDNYTGSETEAQQYAVAMLMKLCGQALLMDYNIASQKGSSAYSSENVNALRNYFGYDPSVRCELRKTYTTDEWDELVYTELANGRPVLYSGQSTSGGHAFVVDGYSNNGLYHINWGWGGDSDQYFLLSVLNPNNNAAIGSNSSDDGYSIDQEVVVGISCDGQGEASYDALFVEDVSLDGSTIRTRASADANFEGIKVYMNIWNYTGISDTFLLAASIQNADGSWAVDNVIDPYVHKINNNYMVSDTWLTVSFGAGLPDGDYYIVPVCTLNGISQWTNCTGSNTQTIRATISGNTLTLTPPTVDLVPSLPSVINAKVGETTELNIPITNYGTYYNNNLFLLIDNENVVGRMLEVLPGETAVWNVDFMPTSLGTQTLQLSYKKSMSTESPQIPFANTRLNVTADVISVSDALDIISPLNKGQQTPKQYAVEGIVTGNVSYNAENKYMDFDITDVDYPTQKLHIYRADKYNGDDITNSKLIMAGDRILIVGCLKKDGTTPEQIEGNIVSITPDSDPTVVNTLENAERYSNSYNLAGQKVTDNYRGIVIINGRRIMRR